MGSNSGPGRGLGRASPVPVSFATREGWERAYESNTREVSSAQGRAGLSAFPSGHERGLEDFEDILRPLLPRSVIDAFLGTDVVPSAAFVEYPQIRKRCTSCNRLREMQLFRRLSTGLYTRSRCALCLHQAYYHNSFGNEGDRYVLLQTSESGFYWSHPALQIINRTRGWFLAYQAADTTIVNWALATAEARSIASPPPPMLPLVDHGVWQDTTTGATEWPHPNSHYATPDHPIDG